MSVQDEIEIANSLLRGPKIPMDMQACKSIGGGSQTGPSSIPMPSLKMEEVTKRDIQRPRQSNTPISARAKTDIQRDLMESQRIMGVNQTSRQELTEDLGFDGSVERLFECINAIDSQIEEYSTSRVGQKMLEQWEALKPRFQRFELYFDRTMSKL